MKSLLVIIANVEAPAEAVNDAGAVLGGLAILLLAGAGAVSIAYSFLDFAKKKWGPKSKDVASEVKNLAANPGRPMRRSPGEAWLPINPDTVYLLTKEGPQTSTVKTVRDGIFEAACYPFSNPIIPTYVKEVILLPGGNVIANEFVTGWRPRTWDWPAVVDMEKERERRCAEADRVRNAKEDSNG